jgi:broad specificity phosphatase PhoE
MEVLLLRHAETDFNEQQLINGQIDEPLSKAGRLHLPEIARLVTTEDLTVIYSSPLVRAVDTAQPIADLHGLTIIKDPHLIEVNCGSFSGKPWDSTIEVFGKSCSALLSSEEYDFTNYGGERSAQVRARVEDFLTYLKSKPDQTPLIVTHGGIIRMFYAICTGEIPAHIPHAEVSRLTVN